MNDQFLRWALYPELGDVTLTWDRLEEEGRLYCWALFFFFKDTAINVLIGYGKLEVRGKLEM